MSTQGVEAVRADREEVLAVAKSLSDEEWQAPSDCEGWRVQDVIAHMANVFRTVVDPSALAPGVPGDLEATQSAQAEGHRDWTADQVLGDYEAISAQGLAALEGLQAEGVADTVIPIENAGMYPLHLVANAMAFDHFCHLRNDILRPNGPVDRPAPPADDLRLGATMEWLLAGLPQMSGAPLEAAVTDPIGLRLTGPGGGEWTIAKGDDGLAVGEEVPPDVRATIASTVPEFILWATKRRPWREREVSVEGDETYAASVLDALHLF